GPTLVPTGGPRHPVGPGHPLVSGRAGLSGRSRGATPARAGDGGAHVPLRLGAPTPVHASQARRIAGSLPRTGGSDRGARGRAAGAVLDAAAAPVHGLPPAGGRGVDRGAPRRRGGAGRGPPAPQARPPPALSGRLSRAADRRPPLRIPQLRGGMTARAFTGLRVVLVAAFNRRYHRSGLALAAALEGLGCEVRRCEERRRGWNALFGRSLPARLAACLRAGPVDVVLVFKGARLAPADVTELRRRCGGLVCQLAEVGVVSWGRGWPRGPLYGEDFVRALAGAAVGVNIQQQFGDRGDPVRYGTGANMRVFELAVVGTPQLSDAKVDMARHFTPDREIVLYRSAAELAD